MRSHPAVIGDLIFSGSSDDVKLGRLRRGVCQGGKVVVEWLWVYSKLGPYDW